jgi:hypothetical protein
MESRINYITLLIVIIIGVTAGNLLSQWIANKFLDSESKVEIAEISNSVPQKTNKPINDTAQSEKPLETIDTASQAELMAVRKQDENGIRLAKKCQEWKVAHKDMQTQTSERGMIKHCEAYEEYINTGSLPDK